MSTTFVPKRFRPVEERLACRERFAHLFWPEREEVLREYPGEGGRALERGGEGEDRAG